jgi:hypothetical protein
MHVLVFFGLLGARWCPGFSRFPLQKSPKGYTPAREIQRRIPRCTELEEELGHALHEEELGHALHHTRDRRTLANRLTAEGA